MTNTTLGFHQGEAEIEENPPRESSTYTHTHTHFTFYPIAFCYNNKKKKSHFHSKFMIFSLSNNDKIN